MKRLLALGLAASCAFSLAACGKEEKAPETTLPVTAATTYTETTAPVFETQTEIIWDVDEAYLWETQLTETTETTVETEPQLELPDKFTRLEEMEVVYATQDVNIRMKPTVQSKSPGKLKAGQSADRIATSSDGWSAVLIDNDLQYISSQYLTTKASGEGKKTDYSKVKETAANDIVYTNHWVNLRQGPGADTAGLGQIPKGTKLQRIAICDNGWSKVNYNGQVGYAAGGYLSATPPTDTTEATTETTAETTTATTTAAAADTSESTAAEEHKNEENKNEENKNEENKNEENKNEENKNEENQNEENQNEESKNQENQNQENKDTGGQKQENGTQQGNGKKE